MPFALWVILGVFAIASSAASKTVLLYTANRHGEIKPCSCRDEPIGGIDRMARRVKEVRSVGQAVFLDAGETFFSSPQLNPARTKSELKRAQAIAKSYKQMGLAAILPGERDFALGVSVLKTLISTSGAVAVSANLEAEQLDIRTSESVSTAEFKILVTGLSDFDGAKPKAVKTHPPEESLKKVLNTKEAKEADRIVVLSHLGEKVDRELAKKFPGLFFLGARTQDFYEKPIQEKDSFLFEPGIEGQRLGEITLSKEKPGFSSAILTELTDVFDSLGTK